MPQEMTLETFLKKFKAAATLRKFSKIGSEIRCETGDCPITSVARLMTGTAYTLSNTKAAAQAIGLSGKTMAKIINAADHTTVEPELRRELLRRME